MAATKNKRRPVTSVIISYLACFAIFVVVNNLSIIFPFDPAAFT